MTIAKETQTQTLPPTVIKIDEYIDGN